jgi:hypothetical protein
MFPELTGVFTDCSSLRRDAFPSAGPIGIVCGDFAVSLVTAGLRDMWKARWIHIT